MAVTEGWEDEGVARWEGREDAFTAKFGAATLIIASVQWHNYADIGRFIVMPSTLALAFRRVIAKLYRSNVSARALK